MPVTVISGIDDHIKKTFHLFEGKRSFEEDKMLYTKIYDLCFSEILVFIEQYIDAYKQNILQQHLETVESSSLSEEKKQLMAYDLVYGALEDIPQYRVNLYNRLEYFISCLAYA